MSEGPAQTDGAHLDPSHLQPFFTERTSLLHAEDESRSEGYRTMRSTRPSTPAARPSFRKAHSYVGNSRGPGGKSRRNSFSTRLSKALGTDANQTTVNEPATARANMLYDDRVWYDQFTSTDWVHDIISDAARQRELRRRVDWRGRLWATLDGAQGWILVLIIGVVTAGFAYVIDITETALFDYKEGFCTSRWWYSRSRCCDGASTCENWALWSRALLGSTGSINDIWIEFGAFFAWVVMLSTLACLVTLQTKTSISSAISLSTLDENLAAEHHNTKYNNEGRTGSLSPTRRFQEAARRPPVVYYPAAGSGVAEVKVILSGFVLHGYLGVKTLICKTIGLVLSVASGLSLGKEGPYVHIATCIGNITSRFFPKYRDNDAKRREVLAASAAAGVAVAFGAPIGGVLFSLEEVSYYFPNKTLFRTFFACIAAALSLKFLNPYGTGKIVLFEVRYLTDWKFFEIFVFILIGIIGGLVGAFFIKASRFWAKRFRSIEVIKKYPLVEVWVVAVATALVSFWNRYTRLPVAELLFELSAPCNTFTGTGFSLCPTEERIPQLIWYLCVAFLIKSLLTTVTFGIKVPAGIYVPSMVFGALLGRIVGHFIQYLTLASPGFSGFLGCTMNAESNPESCVVPGVYALVGAGATMCGITRLTVTLAVILFELTGSLEHVLPFSVGILAAKWTAQAIEPFSIYDLLTDMNAYPYLDSKVRPVFTTNLGDITHPLEPLHYIDISISPLVAATELRAKLNYLHMAGELDGGLPILRDDILIGLLPAPDLEYALDCLDNESTALCLMSPNQNWIGSSRAHDRSANRDDDLYVDGNASDDQRRTLDPGSSSDLPGLERDSGSDPADLTIFVDPAPVALDVSSSVDLVFECFVKLGLRYICVLRDGKFAGLVHKKAFVRYVKDVFEGKEI